MDSDEEADKEEAAATSAQTHEIAHVMCPLYANFGAMFPLYNINKK
jgi:hypothetical protein